jgi:hypothetical protein
MFGPSSLHECWYKSRRKDTDCFTGDSIYEGHFVILSTDGLCQHFMFYCCFERVNCLIRSSGNLVSRARTCQPESALELSLKSKAWFSEPYSISFLHCTFIGSSDTRDSMFRRTMLLPSSRWSEDWGSMDLRNVGILPQNYTVSQSKKPESSQLWKSQISCPLVVSQLTSFQSPWMLWLIITLTISTDIVSHRPA